MEMTDLKPRIVDWHEGMTIEPDQTLVVRGMPADLYHATKRMSQSQLKHWSVSALDGLHKSVPNETESTPLMRGGAVHCLLLDGEDEFNATYYTGGPINPSTGATYGRDSKKFQEWIAQQDNDAKYLTEQEMDAVRGMAEAVRADGFADDLITMPGCERELSLFWTETIMGRPIPCKARLDWWHPDVGLVDAKSADDPEPRAFAKSVATFGWHIQAFWYPRGAVKTGLNNKPPKYGWIAMQSRAPYKIAPYRPDPFMLACGRAMAYKGLCNYARYLESGEARQPSSSFGTIKLPSYAWPEELDIIESESVLS